MNLDALNTEELIEYEKLLEWRYASESLLGFTETMFPSVYGNDTPFVRNWHHELICRELEKVLYRGKQRIMIFLPPQYSKSLFSSRFLPAWVHSQKPDEKIVVASYSAELANSFNRDYQQIIRSTKFQEMFPNIRIGSKSDKKKETQNLAEIAGYNGYYLSSSVGGSLTGRTSNILILDDLYSGIRQADSAAYRKDVISWYNTVARTRLSKFGSIILLFTRWHPEDLAGHLLQMQLEDPHADKWEVIKIPLVAEGKLHKEDPRSEGDPLWPEFKDDLEQVAAIKAASSEREFQAVYQQNPIIKGGNLVKENDLRYFSNLPSKTDLHIIVGDLRFGKKKDSGSFVCFQYWVRAGEYKYLVDQKRGRWGYAETKRQFQEFCRKHPKARLKYIENKANAPAMEDELCSIIPGIKLTEPQGDKVSRLHYVEDEFESNSVYIPRDAEFTREYVQELTAFPQAPNDDQVDCTTQALAVFKEKRAKLNKARKTNANIEAYLQRGGW